MNDSKELVRFLKHMSEVHGKVAPIDSLKYLESANMILDLEAKLGHARKRLLELINELNDKEERQKA